MTTFDIKISDHIHDVSIPKRFPKLKKLDKAVLDEFLIERIQLAKILEKNDPLYSLLAEGMPGSKRNKRYYKIDTSPDYPFIYVIHTYRQREVIIEELICIYDRRKSCVKSSKTTLEEHLKYKGQNIKIHI